jgi:hypothetical protein
MTRMRFDPVLVSEDGSYSLGVERVTGRRYLSVEIASDDIASSRFFEISEEEFDILRDQSDAGRAFAGRCRAGEEDARLFSGLDGNA